MMRNTLNHSSGDKWGACTVNKRVVRGEGGERIEEHACSATLSWARREGTGSVN
jgi:hypothetical protein